MRTVRRKRRIQVSAFHAYVNIDEINSEIKILNGKMIIFYWISDGYSRLIDFKSYLF